MAYNEKQVQIIKTAEELFAARGYHGTSVRDIAEAADINIAMISYYFGSKEKLMQALFEERTGGVQLRVELLLKDETLPPIEKIRVLVEDYVQKLFANCHFYKIMVYEQLLEKNPMVTELIDGLKKQNVEIIEKLIKDGQKKGAFKKNIDVVMMMNTLIGVVMQTIISQNQYKNYYNLQDLSREEFEQILKKKLINHIKVLFKAQLCYEA